MTSRILNLYKGMVMRKGFAVLLLSALLPTTLHAAPPAVEVWTRAYHNSCGYYTTTNADFDVTYRETNLPWGTKVTLVSGLAGRDSFREVHWQLQNEIDMPAVASNTWRARRSSTLTTRGAPENYSALEFVIKVTEPGKEPRYISTTTGTGFLRVKFKTTDIKCAEGSSLPNFLPTNIEPVRSQD